jgi:hypothetical protein
MAAIRIILATYRRAHLLPRALASLQAQTWTDWVCELHNDDPIDTAPDQIVRELADPRVTYHPHERNLGVTGTFNHLFSPGAEPLVALLEDDNWWEPRLLDTLRAALQQHPDAEVAWCNLRLWREEADGTWTDLKRTVWPVPPHPGVRRFEWPQPRHVLGHLHSNGAALIRARTPADHLLPVVTAPGVAEAVRERSFHFPLVLVEEPLANFAITRTTARAHEQRSFFQQQVLLAASFFRHLKPGPQFGREVFAAARRKPGRTTHVLALGALLSVAGFRWLRFLRLGDWAWGFAWAVRHPLDLAASLRGRRHFAALWAYLDRHTARQAAHVGALP